eukprot:6570279-Prymnesium_polylepis.1
MVFPGDTRQASPQYWSGCPFQEAVHGQSKRAHRAQVGVTTAASLGRAAGDKGTGPGSAGSSSAGGTSSVVPSMISSRTEAVGAKVAK